MVISETLEKNPLYIKIVNILRYALYRNKNIFQKVRQSKKLDLSDSGLPSNIISSLIAGDSTVMPYIKKYGELLKYKNGKFAPKFDWKTIIDDKDIVWERIESKIDYSYGKLLDDREGKSPEEYSYQDLSNQYVATEGNLEVYKAESVDACISYARMLGNKTKVKYRHCIFTDKNNLFYNYRYGKGESIIYFVYDNSLPPENPKHLITIGVYPIGDTKPFVTYMTTEADNSNATEQTDITKSELVTLYPKLESIIKHIKPTVIPQKELAFYNRWTFSGDGIENEWPDFTLKEKLLYAYIAPFIYIPTLIFKQMSEIQQRASVINNYSYHYDDDKLYYYKNKTELPDLVKEVDARIVEFVDNPSRELQEYVAYKAPIGLRVIQKMDSDLVYDILFKINKGATYKYKYFGNLVRFLSDEYKYRLYLKLGSDFLLALGSDNIELSEELQSRIFADYPYNINLFVNPSKGIQYAWKVYQDTGENIIKKNIS